MTLLLSRCILRQLANPSEAAAADLGHIDCATICVMPIAKLTVEISIPHAQSIKDRRQVVRSIKDKLRHSFNVSVAELDDASLWNRATLGVVALSASAAYLAGQMQEVDKSIHRLADSLSAEVLESYVEDIAD